MLTLTIDGRAVQLSAKDAAFLAECMNAAKAQPGHRFERTHHGAHGVLCVSTGETVRQLPAGVVAFNQRSKGSGAQDANTAPVLALSNEQRLPMPGVSRCGIAARNRYEAACAARDAAHQCAPTKTDC